MTLTEQEKERQERMNRIFYESDSISGYNALFNVVLGQRGCGKTFNFKRKFLRQKGETVWVRRYDKDIEDGKVIETFLTDLLREGYFRDDVFTIKNNIIYMNGDPKIHFIGLSTSLRLKSVSYQNVENIVYDEFIETRKNRNYLPNEVELLYDLVETVNRLRIDRPEVRVWMLANKVSFKNPYFAEWRVFPFEGRFRKYNEGLLVVENYHNQDFSDLKKKSRFGRFIANTRYGDYAIDNKNLRDNYDFIAKHTGDSVCVVNIRLRDHLLGLWSQKDGKIYIGKSNNTQLPTFQPSSDLRQNERPFLKNKKPYTWINESLERGKLYFEDSIQMTVIYELMGSVFK